ncbi:hypothetical protein, partial [Mesorhizobium sp.]
SKANDAIAAVKAAVEAA